MVYYSHLHYQDLSKEDLYGLLKIRQEVFIVEQDCPYLDADGLDQKCYHVMGKKDDEIVACTRIVPKGISYEKYISIGRVVNIKSIRKLGEGKKLMDYSINVCKELFPGEAIKISAQVYLDRFYQDLGFVPTGENYLEDGIPHQAMILNY